MTIPRGQLEAVIREGLVADIFRLERAESILKIIGQRASEINGGPGNHGELFGALQAALTTEAALAAARLFDDPSNRYPTRCVRGVLEYLKSHADELPTIREPYQLKSSLRAMHAPKSLEECVERDPEQFGVKFADYVLLLLDEPERRDDLLRLRELRDKGLAHSEHVERLDLPTWKAISEVVEIAKQVVGVLGWAYFSTAYATNGDYILSADAKGASIGMTRLLSQLYGPSTAT